MAVETYFTVCQEGCGHIIARAFELLIEVEQTDELYLTDEVVNEARRLRSVVDEWVEWQHVVVPEGEQEGDGTDA